MDVQIREARAGDAAAIASLLDQLGYPTGSGQVPSRLDRLAANDRAVVLVAEGGAKVIGLATIHRLSVLNRARDVAWLTALVVDEPFRRAGVGRALATAAEDFARQSGCERLMLTARETRTDAHGFYVGAGFEQTGRRYGKVLP